MLLDTARLDDIRAAVREMSLDGWLLYDFHGVNPVASRVLGIGGMATRRLFVLIPADGAPVAIAHRIELQPLQGFPGTIEAYSTWEELHRHLGAVVSGRKLAMEVSPDDAVPYLDRVPSGVVGLIERLGGSVESSADLVTMFSARWTAQELEDHLWAAEQIADIARTTVAEAIGRPGVREYAVQQQVIERMHGAGLVVDDPPIVGFGANAANPHYEPREGEDAALEGGQVVLLDLWGGRSHNTVFADQTWMGFAGTTPPDDVVRVWETVRSARDAAIGRLRARWPAGEPVTGADLDRAARDVIAQAGYGDTFVHRTGHSIDIELHGSGPNLDSFETDDVRRLLSGIGFSIEPGIYLTGNFGVRSEVNVVLRDKLVQVTPDEPQQDLITL